MAHYETAEQIEFIFDTEASLGLSYTVLFSSGVFTRGTGGRVLPQISGRRDSHAKVIPLFDTQ